MQIHSIHKTTQCHQSDLKVDSNRSTRKMIFKLFLVIVLNLVPSIYAQCTIEGAVEFVITIDGVLESTNDGVEIWRGQMTGQMRIPSDTLDGVLRFSDDDAQTVVVVMAGPNFSSYYDEFRDHYINNQVEFGCGSGVVFFGFLVNFIAENTKPPVFTPNALTLEVDLPWKVTIPLNYDQSVLVTDDDYLVGNTLSFTWDRQQDFSVRFNESNSKLEIFALNERFEEGDLTITASDKNEDEGDVEHRVDMVVPITVVKNNLLPPKFDEPYYKSEDNFNPHSSLEIVTFSAEDPDGISQLVYTTNRDDVIEIVGIDEGRQVVKFRSLELVPKDSNRLFFELTATEDGAEPLSTTTVVAVNFDISVFTLSSATVAVDLPVLEGAELWKYEGDERYGPFIEIEGGGDAFEFRGGQVVATRDLEFEDFLQPRVVTLKYWNQHTTIVFFTEQQVVTTVAPDPTTTPEEVTCPPPIECTTPEPPEEVTCPPPIECTTPEPPEITTPEPCNCPTTPAEGATTEPSVTCPPCESTTQECPTTDFTTTECPTTCAPCESTTKEDCPITCPTMPEWTTEHVTECPTTCPPNECPTTEQVPECPITCPSNECPTTEQVPECPITCPPPNECPTTEEIPGCPTTCPPSECPITGETTTECPTTCSPCDCTTKEDCPLTCPTMPEWTTEHVTECPTTCPPNECPTTEEIPVCPTTCPPNECPATEPIPVCPTTCPPNECPATEEIPVCPTTCPPNECPATEEIPVCPTTCPPNECPATEPIPVCPTTCPPNECPITEPSTECPTTADTTPCPDCPTTCPTTPEDTTNCPVVTCPPLPTDCTTTEPGNVTCAPCDCESTGPIGGCPTTDSQIPCDCVTCPTSNPGPIECTTSVPLPCEETDCPTTECPPTPAPGECECESTTTAGGLGGEECSNTGLVAGIIVTSILFVAAAGAAGFFFFRLRSSPDVGMKDFEIEPSMKNTRSEVGGFSNPVMSFARPSISTVPSDKTPIITPDVYEDVDELRNNTSSAAENAEYSEKLKSSLAQPKEIPADYEGAGTTAVETTTPKKKILFAGAEVIPSDEPIVNVSDDDESDYERL